MMKEIVYCGIDLHKDFLVIGLNKEQDSLKEITMQKIINDKLRILKFFKRQQKYYEIKSCYEAGPGGYKLYRLLKTIGIECEVIAPSLIPVKKGDKVKTDKRDAKKLTELYRGGYLTTIRVPTESEEKDRALVRQRAQYSKKIQRVKQQIGKYLLYMGIKSPYKSNWTVMYMKWLNKVVEELDEKMKFQLKIYLNEFVFLETILKEIDNKILELSESPHYKERVKTLRCYRGIETYTAMALITTVIDFSRFANARQIMGYFGLVSGEKSSSEKKIYTGITKTGNNLIRRLLIEASKHYSYPVRISKALKKRWENQPVDITTRAYLAMIRLNKTYHKLFYKKGANKAAVAVARELSGFIWAAMNNIPLRSKN